MEFSKNVQLFDEFQDESRRLDQKLSDPNQHIVDFSHLHELSSEDDDLSFEIYYDAEIDDFIDDDLHNNLVQRILDDREKVDRLFVR